MYWATEQADPSNVIGHYLSEQAYQATDDWHGDIRLAQYALPTTATSGSMQASGVQFGDAIQLKQFALPAQGVPAGQILPLRLDWNALRRPAGNYKVFVHLLNGQSKIVSQHDSEPASGFRPTGNWNQGETISDLVGLLVPAGTPPGNYSIELGLYRGEDGVRLPVSTGGDHLILAAIRVEK